MASAARTAASVSGINASMPAISERKVSEISPLRSLPATRLIKPSMSAAKAISSLISIRTSSSPALVFSELLTNAWKNR